MTGKLITANEALDIGLVTRFYSEEKLQTEAMKLAEDMAAMAPISLCYLKEAVNQGLEMTLDQGLRLESDLYFLLHTTSDRTEGIRAFLEKRNPRFEGK